MFDRYNNLAVGNMMQGATPYVRCDCGHIAHEYVSQCPNCKAEVTNMRTELSFAPIHYSITKVSIENLEDDKTSFFKFAIIYTTKRGTYNIDFVNKSIGQINREEELTLAVIFDGHQKREDMIKFFDIKRQEYIDDKEFLKALKDFPYSFAYNTMIDDRNNNVLLKLKNNKGEYVVNRKFIKQLNDIADWCAIPYNEILIKSGINPDLLPEGSIVNKQGTTPSDILGIKKYTCKQITKYTQSNNNFLMLKTLEQKLGDKSVEYMDKLVSRKDGTIWLRHTNQIIEIINKENLSISKLARYIYKEVPLNQYIYETNFIIQLYCDCYSMTKQLNLPFDKAPKALMRYHNILMFEIQILADKERNAKIKDVASEFKYLEKHNEKDKFCITIPKSSEEISQEGRNMHHCVGSYVNKMAEKQCVILFLRTTKEKDKSFVTVEYNPVSNAIVQARAKSNTAPSQKALNYLEEWAAQHDIINYY